MRSRRHSLTLFGLVFATTCTSLGCGSGDGIERVSVSGTVTYGGQTVEVGQIRFMPQPGTVAPVTIEPIADGYYETKTSGGVPVGTHRVEITGYDREQYENAPVGPGAAPPRQLLPTKYNRETTLEITVESGQDATVRDFELVP
jgi:hypothetical protein